MKKHLAALLCLILALSSLSAFAQDGTNPGDIPSRGVILPLTQDDIAAGMSVQPVMLTSEDIAEIPAFDITYTDVAGFEAGMAKFSQEDLQNQDKFAEILAEAFSHIYTTWRVVLLENEYFDEKTAQGLTPADITGMEGALFTDKNDGYSYLIFDMTDLHTFSSEELKEKVLQSAQRAKALLDEVSYQAIVFEPGEFSSAASMEAFPSFTTQDIYGETITQDIFSGKDLTVVNVWGTYCGPCINEMPDLAQWSDEMPENVQLIGLVCDLASPDDADTLETARMICESTGASAYTHLIANQDFAGLLSGVVGVPTTFFVDGNGALVGQPIVGANVPGCRAFVESYLAG